MIDNKARLLQEVILGATQAAVEVSVDATGKRRGLRAHFCGWTRQDGPVFRLTPSGLTRHVLDLRFGSYARPCIDHIEQNATEEQYTVARALVSQLRKQFEVRIYPHHDTEAWKVSTDLRIEVTIKGFANQLDEDAVTYSAQNGMVPLIAAVAELIGCDDDVSEERGDEEGACFEMTIKRRERSRRNRLLCLAIHGPTCTVCGVDPTSIFGPECGQILEVHHLEPLSEVAEPKKYDPKTDLIPLCPNCHRAIHRRKPAYNPDELRAQMPNT
jgi:5-methylcytosine-specific restriction protein A